MAKKHLELTGPAGLVDIENGGLPDQDGYPGDLSQLHRESREAIGHFATLLYRATDVSEDSQGGPGVRSATPFALEVFTTAEVEELRLGVGRHLSRITPYDARGSKLVREALIAASGQESPVHQVHVRELFRTGTNDEPVDYRRGVTVYQAVRAPEGRMAYRFAPRAVVKAETALGRLLSGLADLQRPMRDYDLNPEMAARLARPSWSVVPPMPSLWQRVFRHLGVAGVGAG